MASHKTYIHRSRREPGFTLIEIIVVIGILALLTTLSGSVRMESFHGYSFRDERNNFVATLEHARSEAMNNVCEGSLCTGPLSHGVHVENGRYILFQGYVYNPSDPQNLSTPLNPTITISGFSDVIFTPLSGDASTTPTAAWTTVLTDTSGHISTTTINSEGMISWTN